MGRLRDASIRVKLLGLIALSSMLSLLVAGAVMVAYDAQGMRYRERP